MFYYLSVIGLDGIELKFEPPNLNQTFKSRGCSPESQIQSVYSGVPELIPNFQCHGL